MYVWSAALGKILTHDNLRKKNIVVIEWCCMCKKKGKSIDHLLLHCDAARELWSFMFSLFGVEWVMPQTVLDLLTTWGAFFGHGLAKKVWQLVPHCVL